MISSFHAANVIPSGNWIWVFSTNEGGKLGKGWERIARVNFRADYGCGSGPSGHAYAIATRDKKLQIRSMEAVAKEVEAFLQYAKANPKLNFFVTRIGCDVNGFTDAQIGPLFAAAPANCSLPEAWKQYVTK